MAAGVGRALGLTLSGEGLAANAPAAARAMERSSSDQERAAAYLEALFLAAGVPQDRLAEVRACLAQLHQQQHLGSAVVESTPSAWARLKAAGFLLGVVSNSEGRVEEALAAAGLRQFFDVVVDSARVGIEKPDPRIFQAALEALSVSAEEALYVGDLYEVDILGAQSAGIDAVLLGTLPAAGSRCRTAGSIADLADSLVLGNGSMTPLSRMEEG